MVRNMVGFYGEEFSSSHTNPKPEDDPLSAVRDWLLNIFAATLHTECRFTIRNLTMNDNTVK
jgi:hypothetical protein